MSHTAQAWFRSLTHYIFLADPRTWRIVGEPKRANPPIIKTSIDAGMHLETVSTIHLPKNIGVVDGGVVAAAEVFLLPVQALGDDDEPSRATVQGRHVPISHAYL